jgi:ABC-type oligopeptide transport system ATPase subunit
VSRDLLIARDIHVAFGGEPRLFRSPAPRVDVLRGVSIRIARRETVGVVGESGSGKTTLGRVLLRLVDVAAGSVEFDGQDITRLPEAAMRPLRRRMQPIFQDPLACLNPRQTILRIVTEPMLFHGVAADRADAEAKARAIFDRFSLPAACLGRYPHELSGGQRQRVGIARAALLAPDFLLADEIVSGLDVSIQAQLLNLLTRLRTELGFAMLFISHDLSVVRHLCSQVLVMYRGEIVEEGSTDTVFADPQHQHTRELLSSVPPDDPEATWPALALAQI